MATRLFVLSVYGDGVVLLVPNEASRAKAFGWADLHTMGIFD